MVPRRTVLVALAAAPYLGAGEQSYSEGVQALVYYLVAYGAMTIGAFAVIAYLSTPDRPVENVDDLAPPCEREGRRTFIAPLRPPTGTGSPVNPIAML